MSDTTDTISIHAPARGATPRNSVKGGIYLISIHAPARGATSVDEGYCRQIEHFNPRSREGSDFVTALRIAVFLFHFNPRSREGSDFQFYFSVSSLPIFQSTLPRGERRIVIGSAASAKNISIHAPARGATAQVKIHGGVIRISIHAPARGATQRQI